MGLAVAERGQNRPDLEYILYQDGGFKVYSDNTGLVSRCPQKRSVILHGVVDEKDLRGSVFEGCSDMQLMASAPNGEKPTFTQLTYPLYEVKIPDDNGDSFRIKIPVMRERRKFDQTDGSLRYHLLWLSGHFHSDIDVIKRVDDWSQFDSIQSVAGEKGEPLTLLSVGIRKWFSEHADIWVGRSRIDSKFELFNRMNGTHIDENTVRTLKVVELKINPRNFEVWLDGQVPPEYVGAVEFLSKAKIIEDWVSQYTGNQETHLVIPHTR